MSETDEVWVPILTEEECRAVEKENPTFYFTNEGKGQGGRYEHLALWYVTSKEERLHVVGAEARAKYLKAQKPFDQPEIEKSLVQVVEDEQVDTQLEQVDLVETQPEIEQVLEIDAMTISSLKLDAETQEMVENAIAQSGMSIAEFIQQACTVYAKTVTGKSRKYSKDLSYVETETLRKDKAYSTHPGRAGELVKRAVQAIKQHNGQSTELSQKWLITQSLIADMTGAKAAAVKAAMQHYQTDINNSNKSLKDDGATDLLNRKGGKEAFCNDWVHLIPSGID